MSATLAFARSNNAHSAAAPVILFATWMAAAMAMDRERFREALEERDILLLKKDVQLKQKDELLKLKDDEHAQVVEQMTRDHAVVAQMLDAKAAATNARHAAEVRSA
ncbi:hypothetical protein HDU81_010510 [Chytriomyces hyalinus]|nr:hypothetical protein HDU81_010510 [Chytriomyces hyalinus]